MRKLFVPLMCLLALGVAGVGNASAETVKSAVEEKIAAYEAAFEEYLAHRAQVKELEAQPASEERNVKLERATALENVAFTATLTSGAGAMAAAFNMESAACGFEPRDPEFPSCAEARALHATVLRTVANNVAALADEM